MSAGAIIAITLIAIILITGVIVIAIYMNSRDDGSSTGNGNLGGHGMGDGFPSGGGGLPLGGGQSR